MMEAETHSKAEVVAYCNRNYVNVKVDYEKDKKTTGGFPIKKFPGTAIVSPEGKYLLIISGFRPLREFMEALRKAHEARKMLDDNEKREKDPVALKAAAGAARALLEDDKAKALYQKALDAMPSRASKGERKFAAECLAGLLQIAVEEFRFAYKPASVEPLEIAAKKLAEADAKNEFDSADDLAAAAALAELKRPDNAKAEAAARAAMAKFPKSDRFDTMVFVAASALLFQEKRGEAEPFLKTLVERFPDTTLGSWASRVAKSK